MKRLAMTLAAILVAAPLSAQDAEMSFFITSVNPGNGADLGGLEGADAYCSELATAAGVTGRTWRAYLSTTDVNARDRIGAGPWVNANGVEIAADLDALHGENNLNKETALDESGNVVNGRGDDPNRHDILTGSNADGTFAGQSCEDWTASGEGSAVVGHHDRMGLDESPPALSWNSSHPSRGCSLEALRGTGGDGLFYCFAAE
ncbi:hypothetical protein ACW9UR_14260 [Halovulum sp. GXIMD14794]